jgi:hypothetical protein
MPVILVVSSITVRSRISMTILTSLVEFNPEWSNEVSHQPTCELEPNEAALETPGKKDTETPNEPTTATRTTGRTVPEPMSKPEPEAATKPRFVEAVSPPSETAAPAAAAEDTTANQPTNPAGPAATAPSAVGMRDDSTQAQNDTRPPAAETTSAASTARTPATTTTATAATNAPNKIPGTAAEADTTDTTTPTTGSALAAGKPAQPPSTKTKEETLQKPSSSDDDATTTPDIKVEGPGPRPLEEIAREHGGDAGAGGEVLGHQQQRRRDSGKGLAAEEGGGEGERVGGKGVVGAGTGEEYVKSSGLAADGGDFDASRPGAGREADRLLEQKGVHLPSTQHHGTDTSRTSHSSHGSHGSHGENGGKEKVGLKEKIKAKLHKSSTPS